MRRFCAAALCVLGTSACSTPDVLALHSPMQPTAAQPVTFTVRAEDDDRIEQVDILEEIWTLSNCSNGLNCGTRGPVTVVHTCTYSPPQELATCAFTRPTPYPDGVIVAYRAEARDTENDVGADGWIYFAAGAYPWPDEAIPIYVRGDPHETIDVVFIPDTDYGGDAVQFVQDVDNLITSGYLTLAQWGNEFRRARGRWNFYVTYAPGEAIDVSAGCTTAPSNWALLRTVVDAGAVIHNDSSLRDCSGLPPGALFTSPSPTVAGNANWILTHETGHAVFGLADEYCCDGGYHEVSPHGNMFATQASCEASATEHGWPITDCRQLLTPDTCGRGTTSTWWRVDQGFDLMGCRNFRFGAAFGRADVARINWMYIEQCNSASGC